MLDDVFVKSFVINNRVSPTLNSHMRCSIGFHLEPPGGWWLTVYGDGQINLVGQSLQLGLPEPTPVAVEITWERLKNQIWSLPEEVSNGPFSWAVKFGFHYAKEDVIDDIEKPESRDRLRKQINLKRELIKMKERLQDRSANL